MNPVADKTSAAAHVVALDQKPRTSPATVPTGGFYAIPGMDETEFEYVRGATLSGEVQFLHTLLEKDDAHPWHSGNLRALSQELGHDAPNWTMRLGGRRTNHLAAIIAGASSLMFSATPMLTPVDAEAFPLLGDQVEARPPVPTAQSPAYKAFKELGTWLHVDDEQVAQMLGIGRTTAYSWNRVGGEPRAQTARRLYEYHAVLDSLRRRLGSSTLALWLREGQPSRRDMLLEGRLDELDRDVHAVLFRPAADERPDLAWAPEQVDVQLDAGGEQEVRRSTRRPRRARLS